MTGYPRSGDDSQTVVRRKTSIPAAVAGTLRRRILARPPQTVPATSEDGGGTTHLYQQYMFGRF